MSYAALTYYNANNLGDEIQSLASMQFLPNCNFFVDRDTIGNEKRNLKLIGNAFWNRKDMKYPFFPKDNIKMFPISMHISDKNIELDWFRKNQPIGCRDLPTMKFLKSKGIKSYFSGCMTLTFPYYNGERKNNIVLVDSYNYENVKYPKDIEVIKKSPFGNISMEDRRNPLKRIEIAKELLEIYKTAGLVISSRVHAILPCIAMGTPVIPIHTNHNSSRLSGYDLPRYKVKDFDIKKNYKIKRPEKLIEDLKKRVLNFINE